MGHITNEHLAKLWDFMASYNCKSEANPSDILEAFLECDEALSDLANERDHWQVMYANACGDQDVLKESIRLQDIAYRKLELKCEDLKKEYKSLQGFNLDIITKNDEAIRQLREENDALHHVIDDFVEKVKGKDDELQDLQKKCDELNKDYVYMTKSRDYLSARAEHAGAKVEELQKKLDLKQHDYNGACKDRDSKAEAVVKLAKIRDQLQEALDNVRAELAAKVKRMDEITSDRVKLSEENRKLKARTDCLREEVKWCRKHYKEQSDKIQELKKKLTEANDILEETNRDRNDWRRRALMTKLPDVKEEHTITLTMGETTYKILLNILSSKAFGASTEYMRDFLTEFCGDRYFCQGCPLRFSDCDFDNMSDEEIETHYKMAIDAQSETEKPGDA